MNSSVKQAQKDGATIEDISAGLSLSVVKNALYKVIRASSPDELGKRVVVQGGTFLNDAVLRAFEQEMGVEVVRPNIAGLMGAYGAALYAKKKSKGVGKSTITDKKGLDEFVHEIKVANCGMCNNNCRLTINSFGKGRKFIAGNRCERPITKKAPANDMNMYAYKLNLIDSYKPVEGIRGKLGIPMALNMYELYPFWYRFFTELKFEVFHSPYSTRKLYQRGQQTIPSDTVCFPAKLVHGHIQTLIDMGAETIFYGRGHPVQADCEAFRKSSSRPARSKQDCRLPGRAECPAAPRRALCRTPAPAVLYLPKGARYPISVRLPVPPCCDLVFLHFIQLSVYREQGVIVQCEGRFGMPAACAPGI